MNEEWFKILNGDVFDMLKTIPDNSVDTVMTSPPYWQMRDYDHSGQLGHEEKVEDYINNMVKVGEELFRVLKETGLYFLNVDDKFVNGELQLIPYRIAFEISKKGWKTVMNIPWIKPNGIPRDARYRLRHVHEPIMVFAKNLTMKYWFNQYTKEITSVEPESVYMNCPNDVHTNDKYCKFCKDTGQIQAWYKMPYYFDNNGVRTKWNSPGEIEATKKSELSYIDAFFDVEVKTEAETTHVKQYEKNSTAIYRNLTTKRSQLKEMYEVVRDDGLLFNPIGRTSFDYIKAITNETDCVDAWEMTTKPDLKHQHEAAYPPWLCLIPVMLSCPPDGTVLDPFNGSASTGVAALLLKRKYIGVELNPDYAKMSIERLSSVPIPSEIPEVLSETIWNKAGGL